MLRPSSLLSGTGSTSSSTPTTPTSAPKSFLRPATFQVGSTTDDSAASDSASEATPPVGESSSHLAASSSTPSSVANNPFLSLINQKEDDHPEADNEAKPKTTENGKQVGFRNQINVFLCFHSKLFLSRQQMDCRKLQISSRPPIRPFRLRRPLPTLCSVKMFTNESPEYERPFEFPRKSQA